MSPLCSVCDTIGSLFSIIGTLPCLTVVHERLYYVTSFVS